MKPPRRSDRRPQLAQKLAQDPTNPDTRPRYEFSVHPDALLDRASLAEATQRATGISKSEIEDIEIERRSIDARRGRVRVLLQVSLRLAGTSNEHQGPRSKLQPHDPPALRGESPVAIVGAGPAGLFCAIRLAELGIRSVIFERGYDVQKRRLDLAALNRDGQLNPESNYCFGEGGAGTYSDGKLYTRSGKRGSIRWVLELLAQHGAPEDILVDSRPHVGTNRLPKVIASLREWLRAAGSEVHFGQRVDQLHLDSSRKVRSVGLASRQQFECEHLVVAAGHSAPDVLRWLSDAGVALRPKPFAVGVRIEHPQALIDVAQYGDCAGHPALGAASYHLVESVLGRSVHSFCMCPGGVIVPSTTQKGHQVVNGMSPYQRRGKRANSGFVVQMLPEHLRAAGYDEKDPWSGVRYIEALERRAYECGGGNYVAPAQRLCDLVAGRASQEVGSSSYHRGLAPVDLRAVLQELFDPIAGALAAIQSKIPDFLSPDAVAIAAESRTSSPIQIPRDPENLQSHGAIGVYACGEGAGFAGGIVSAAIEGKRVAEAIAGEIGQR